MSMPSAILENGAYLQRGSIATLKSKLKQDGISASIPKSPQLPITIGSYSLVEIVNSERPTSDVVREIDPAMIGGVLTQQWESREFTAEEQAAEDAESQRIATSIAKKEGVEFTDTTGANSSPVMCSAGKEDMFGLNSVEGWVSAGNSTNFEFENGNILRLTPSNIEAFKAVWVPFRASFYE